MKLEGGMKLLVVRKRTFSCLSIRGYVRAGRWDEKLEGGMKFYI